MQVLSRPPGKGLEFLGSSEWPTVPVLILGQPGTGRREWANYLLRCHEALPSLILSNEKTNWSFLELVKYLSTTHLVPSQGPTRWANLVLDDITQSDQISLLSLIENLPDNCNFIVCATPERVSPELVARCCVFRLTPPSLIETENVLTNYSLRRHEAEKLAELRPGQPGLALELRDKLALRSHFNSILSAVEVKDSTALASSLMTCTESDRWWFKEWINLVLAKQAAPHPKLIKEIDIKILLICMMYLEKVPNPRLAVRAATSLLITRK